MLTAKDPAVAIGFGAPGTGAQLAPGPSAEVDSSTKPAALSLAFNLTEKGSVLSIVLFRD